VRASWFENLHRDTKKSWPQKRSKPLWSTQNRFVNDTVDGGRSQTHLKHLLTQLPWLQRRIRESLIVIMMTATAMKMTKVRMVPYNLVATESDQENVDMMQLCLLLPFCSSTFLFDAANASWSQETPKIDDKRTATSITSTTTTSTQSFRRLYYPSFFATNTTVAAFNCLTSWLMSSHQQCHINAVCANHCAPSSSV
jgi:hypothetical protein